MLGATAGGAWPDLTGAMTAMAPAAAVFTPVSGAIADAHAQRYAAFTLLQQAARLARSAADRLPDGDLTPAWRA